MSTGSDLISLIASRQNLDDYQKKHWTGSFAEYLDIVRSDPKVTRTAYQRIYDMIISHGTEEVMVNKEKLLRYKFFEDPENQGQDAIFGLERTLIEPGQHPQERRQRLRDRAARAAAARAGRQLQEHARPAAEEGAGAVLAGSTRGPLQLRLARRRAPTARRPIADCPMHEEPLHLIPQRAPRRGHRAPEPRAAAPTTSTSRSRGTSARSAARCSTSGWSATAATGRGSSTTSASAG